MFTLHDLEPACVILTLLDILFVFRKTIVFTFTVMTGSVWWA